MAHSQEHPVQPVRALQTRRCGAACWQTAEWLMCLDVSLHKAHC